MSVSIWSYKLDSELENALERASKLYRPEGGMHLGLERVRRLLKKLGNPEQQLPPTIHFAGTNGKGSTLAHLKALLESVGKSVHTYTSPHLVNITERIQLNGKPICQKLLKETLEEVLTINDGDALTFFEFFTAVSFLLFARHKADYLLLETGLGGRLDATNVINRPLLSIITPISHDHTEFLGDTLAKIAFEKAGIIKDSCPVITGTQAPEVMDVLKTVAKEKNAQFWAQDHDWFLKNDLYEGRVKQVLPPSGLAGDHQVQNFYLSFAALDFLKITPSLAQLKNAAKNVSWPGRLQKLHGSLAKKTNATLVVDGAHNDDGARILNHYLKTQDIPTTLIVCMMARKNATSFLGFFKGLVNEVIIVPLSHVEGAAEPNDLLKIAQDLGFNAHIKPSLLDAVTHIQTPQGVICGSLYLCGHALFLDQEKEHSF